MTCKRRFSDTKFCLQNPPSDGTPSFGKDWLDVADAPWYQPALGRAHPQVARISSG